MTDLTITLLQTISNQLAQLIQVSTPESPNYRRRLDEYPDFIWQDINAVVIGVDDHGAVEVEWHGHRFLRRSGDGKFGEAIWFSRPIGQGENGGAEYARLITFKVYEAEPLADLNLPAPAEHQPQPKPADLVPAPPESKPTPPEAPSQHEPTPDPERPYSAQTLRENAREFVILSEQRPGFQDPETGESLPVTEGPMRKATPNFISGIWQEILKERLKGLKQKEIEAAYHMSLNYLYFGVKSANDLTLAQAWPILFIMFNSLAKDIYLGKARKDEEITWDTPVSDIGKEEIINLYIQAKADKEGQIPF